MTTSGSEKIVKTMLEQLIRDKVFANGSVLGRIECIVFKIIHLATLQTTTQFITATIAFVSESCGGVVTATLMALFNQWDASNASEQAGDWARQGFGALLDNYRSLKHSELLRRFRTVAAMLIAGELLKDNPFVRDKVVAPLADGAKTVAWDAWDFGEEILNLVRHVWDVTSECIVTQSWGPLMGSNKEVNLIESERAFLRANLEWYLLGSLSRITDGPNVVHPASFIARVESYLTRVTTYHKRCSMPAERVVLARYLAEAHDMQARVKEHITVSSTRVEPICFKLDGTTGVGKSAIMNTLVRDTLRIAGAPFSDEHIAVVDSGSKYMDTVTNKTQGLLMDDVANTLPRFSTVDELIHVIRVKNTIKTPVNKAAVDQKGSTFLDVKVMVISTNAPMLAADVTSCEPSAILRRFAYHIQVDVAPQHAKDNGRGTLRMLDPSTLEQGIYTYAQRFTVREWIPSERRNDGKDTGNFRVVVAGLNYSQLMEFLAPHIRAHFQRQTTYMDEMKTSQFDQLCAHGFTTARMCHMCRTPREEAGDQPLWGLFQQRPQPSPPPQPEQQPNVFHAFSWWQKIADPLGGTAAGFAKFMLGRANLEQAFINRPRLFLAGMFGLFPAFGTSVTMLITAMCGFTLSPWWTPMIFSWWAYGVAGSIVAWVKARVSGKSLAEIQGIVLKHAMGFVGVSFAVLLGGLTLFLAAKGLKSVHSESGDQPKTGSYSIDDTADFRYHKRKGWRCKAEGFERPCNCRDCVDGVQDVDGVPPEVRYQEEGGCASVQALPDPKFRPDVWERRDLATFGHTDGPVATMTADQIIRRIERQHFVVTINYASGNIRRSNALFVATNLALLPAHNFLNPDGSFSEIVSVDFRRVPAEFGPVFSCKVGKSVLSKLPGDLMLFQTNVGGTMVDLSCHFPAYDVGVSKRFPALEMRRELETCVPIHQRYYAVTKVVTSSQYGWSYDGLEYTRDSDTFVGLCGALIISDERHPVILGVHTMGGGPNGVACRVTGGALGAARAALLATSTVRAPSVEQSTTEVHVTPGYERMGVVGELNSRSTFREAPIGAPLIPYGTLINQPQVRAKSRLHTSPISELVEEICGNVRIHGPPKNIGKATVEATKMKEFTGMSQLDPDILGVAATDLASELHAVILSANLQPYLKPLTELEACSGIVGSSTLRRVNLKTAAGWPMTGSKHKLVQPHPTELQPEAIVLTDEMRAEVEAAEVVLRKLERKNFVFKGSHKDEATKLTKEKVRIFEGAPFILTFLIRKYFLPIMRVYMLAQFQLGCAVGLDATGVEWHQMYEYLSAYNKDVALEGDWVHYDTSLVYQETMSAFTIWIEAAIAHGSYSEDDIRIMWVLAEEVCRHYAMLKSDIGMVDGWNPSGNGLTTFLNNVCNALRGRASFYGLAPPNVSPTTPHVLEGESISGIVFSTNARSRFAPLQPGLHGRYVDYVREMYYGDDFLIVAKPEILGWFNQETICAWFAAQGKGMTAADKGPFLSPTTKWRDASFLKRGFRFDPELRHVVAPLSLDSIYKSLHVWPKQLAWSPQVHCAVLIGGALRELVLHGREVYEKHVPALLDVAEQFGSRTLIDIDADYESARDAWLER